ncbi:MAG TPA: HAMP domain-containing sensor histidine kinase [Candidatus Eisenbacteria bacterium]|nr:HAMP domain-containing sensor histidine kinase [Candidatus Eisenbacteria bacterium]
MLDLRSKSLRSRVARRIFLVFLFCALIPFAALVVVAYNQVAAFFAAKSQRQLREMAKAYGMDVHVRLMLLEAELETVAVEFTGTRGRARPGALSPRQEDRYHRLDRVALASYSERHVFPGLDPLPELTPAESAHLRSGKALISVLHSARVRSPVIVMRKKLASEEATGLVLAAVANRAFLWGEEARQAMPAYVRACIVGDAGRPLSCDLDPRAPTLATIELMSKNLRAGDLAVNDRGEEHLASYWTIPMAAFFHTPDWTVILIASKEGLFASIGALAWSFSLAVGASVGLAVLFALYQLRKRLTPVEQLHAATREIAAGHFHKRVHVQSNDEFEELAAALNRMAEQLGHQFAALERSNRVKDEFLGMISHELRTPLSVMMGYVELLKGGALGAVSREQTAALEIVGERASQLHAMLEAILEVTGLQTGKVVVTNRAVDVAQVVRQLQIKFSTRASANVALNWTCAGDLPTLMTDEDKLKRILGNLIDNALKFTQKGHVSVTARYLPEPRAVQFEVTDTGIGIAREAQPRVFDAFHQVDSSTARAFEGTGLGLYVAKTLATALHGDIAVESELNRGSRFTLTLPLASGGHPSSDSTRSRAGAPASLEDRPTVVFARTAS